MERHTKLTVDLREYLVLDPRDAVPLSASDAESMLDVLLGDPRQREAFARALGVAAGDLDDPAVRERAIAVLVADWIAIELQDGLSGHAIEHDPRREPVEPVEPKRPENDRPTWIEIAVLDELGGGFPGTRWRLTLADGDERSVILDASSKWRADDLHARGSCHLRVLDIPAETGAVVPSWTGPAEDDQWLSPTPAASVMLTTGRSHRVLIVRGRTEVVLLDDAGRPIAHERCLARVAGVSRPNVTDEGGIVVIWHPVGERELEIEFPALDGVWNLLRSEPLADKESHA